MEHVENGFAIEGRVHAKAPRNLKTKKHVLHKNMNLFVDKGQEKFEYFLDYRI